MKPANPRAADKRRSKRLVTSLAVVVLGVMSLLSHLIWSGYRDAIHEAEIETRNYSATIEARLDATLRRADAEVQALVRTLPVAALSKQALPQYARELNAELDSHLTNFPEVDGLRVFDANGDQLYSSDRARTPFTNIVDRDYFLRLRDNPRTGLVFSEVVISRATGRQSVFMARALPDGQGAFRGVVIAGLNLDYFQKLFQSVDLGAHGVIAIYRSDDFTPVVRLPVVEGKFDTPLPQGNPARAALTPSIKTATIEFASSTDGIVRIYSFHALDRYPFFVATGLAREEMLAGWRQGTLAGGLSGLVLLVLLTGLLFRLWRAERRQALAMAGLAESEERFRATFEHAAVGIAHTTRDKRYLMVNKKFCDMLGYTPDELLAMRTDELPHPDDRGDYTDMKRLLAGEVNTYSGEKRYLRKDGSILWVNRTVSMARDRDGKPLYFIRVIEDIGERKLAEEARAQLAAIVENSNDAIFSRTLDDTILSWNAGAERMLGYTAAEVIGKPTAVTLPPGRPPNLRRNNEALLRGEVVARESDRMTKDGRVINVLTSHSPIRDGAGNIVGASIMLQDITALKRAQEAQARLAAVVENATVAIFTRTLDGIITSWNTGAERMLGYAAADVIGKPIAVTLPPNRPPNLARNNEDLLRGEVVARESDRITKDGRVIIVLTSHSPIRDSAGNIVGASIILQDITVLKRAQETQARLAAIVDGSNDAIVGRSLDRKILSWNAAAERLFGYTAAEIIGQSVSLIVPPEREQESVRNRAALTQGHAVIDLETERLAKDGRRVAVSISQFPIKDEHGAVVGVATIFRDISERKRARETQARLAAIVDGSNDAIVSRSLDRTILSWNAGAERLFGYTAAEIIGQSVSLLIPPERKQDSVRNSELLAQGLAVLDFETERVAKDGRRIPVSLSQSPIKDERGTMVGVATIFRDISERKQAEAALRDSERRYRSVIAAIAEGVVLRDKNARIVACNASAELITGRTLDQMKGNVSMESSWRAIREDGSLISDEDRPAQAALRTGKLQSHVVQGLRKPDGTVLWLSMNVQPLFDEMDTTPSGVVTTFTDITERKQAELRQTMEHTVTRILAEAGTLAEAAPRIIQTICETMGWHYGARWQMDKEAGVLRCIECWGVDTPEIREFMAENSKRTVNPEAPSGRRGLVRRIYNSAQPVWVVDIAPDKSLDRAPLLIKAGLHGAFGFPLLLGEEVLGLMEFFHCDVREPDPLLLRIAESVGHQIGQFIARKQAEERIRHLAHYDELTGLSNRSMFSQHLTRALAQARRNDKALAVLFIDLDRFKNINDTLGHEAGDRVLKEVAERLLGCLRASDTVGRLGGDEFVVLLEELPQPLHVAVVAQKILAAVAKPYMLDAQEFHLTASIGISTYPADSDNMQSLLKNADIAMYRAKEQGKNNYQYYSAQMNVHSLERLELESDLRHALERKEFLLHYQPKTDIVSGRITGMEALVRWQHPTRGLVPPMQFIPLAEETGLIVPIGEWVLKTACARNKSWQEQGLPPLRIAVNLSARQFAHENLLQDVSRVLDETGLDPAALEFEITESMVMHNPERAVKLLTRLKAMGIHLAIDDFGTGYSSLSYLKRFPIDAVKIDRSFIRDLPGDADDAAITRAIIAMAHGLRLKVIAEGVETEEQLRFLRDHACDEMQGYYFSKPVPEHEFVRLVQAGSTAGACP